MGEVGRHPPGNIIAEGLDHAHVDVGVWIEEIPFVVVEVDAFDVNALGGVDNPISRRVSARTSMVFMPGLPMKWRTG